MAMMTMSRYPFTRCGERRTVGGVLDVLSFLLICQVLRTVGFLSVMPGSSVGILVGTPKHRHRWVHFQRTRLDAGTMRNPVAPALASAMEAIAC